MNMNKHIIVGAGLVVIAAAGYWGMTRDTASPVGGIVASEQVVVATTSATPDTAAPKASAPVSSGAAPSAAVVDTPSVPEKAVARYTIAQVAQHASRTDCWIAVSGKVFDLTGFDEIHPGGSREILERCGEDATRAFVREDDHEEVNAWKELQSFYIGELQG